MVRDGSVAAAGVCSEFRGRLGELDFHHGCSLFVTEFEDVFDVRGVGHGMSVFDPEEAGIRVLQLNRAVRPLMDFAQEGHEGGTRLVILVSADDYLCTESEVTASDDERMAVPQETIIRFSWLKSRDKLVVLQTLYAVRIAAVENTDRL